LRGIVAANDLSMRYNQTLGPELLEAMSAAFVQACTALGLSDLTDPVIEIVAIHIIEAAKRGVRTKTALFQSAIEGLKTDAKTRG
jgi:hypothetical protein